MAKRDHGSTRHPNCPWCESGNRHCTEEKLLPEEDCDYFVEMHGEIEADGGDVPFGARRRECCETNTSQWHGRPCTVNGPEGLPTVESDDYWLARGVRITHNLPPGPMVVGEFTHDGTELAQALYGRQAGKLDFDYYRTCCSTAPGSPHWKGCGTNFFAEGQVFVKPDFNPMDPCGPARLRIREDTVASDRTFENETRPL